MAAVNREVRNQLTGLGVLAALLGGAYWARQTLGIEWGAESVRDAVAGFGVWGPILLVALLAFRSVLVIPSQVLLIAAGLCFGAVRGTLYGAVGVTLSGVMWFALVRWLGREFVLNRMPPRIRPALDAAGNAMGASFLALATGYPFGPIVAWHAGAGLTGMAFSTFLLAVALGSTVRAATYTFFGSRFAEADLGQILLATGVLLALTGIPLLFPRSRRFVRRLLDPGAALSNPGPDSRSRSYKRR